MRKIILNVAVSLDGLIEGTNGEFDWCLTDDDYGMTAFMESLDTIIFGRKSFEVLASYDDNPYPDKKKFVFSKKIKKTNISNTEIIQVDAVNYSQHLKIQKGGNIWLFGGKEIVTALLNHDLIDEMILSVHPIILGAGKPLFEGITERKHFHLNRTINYPSGLVQLYYSKKSSL